MLKSYRREPSERGKAGDSDHFLPTPAIAEVLVTREILLAKRLPFCLADPFLRFTQNSLAT